MPRRQWLLLVAAVIVCIVPAVALGEERDYCRDDGKLVLFLVDTTTPYDEIDKAVVVETVNKAFLALKGGDRFVVRTITDSHARSERLFERCLPLCEGGGAVDRFFFCNDGLIRSDTERLRNDMVRALKEKLSRFTELQHSDILRTIDAVATEEIGGDENAELYVFSDLIENSDEISGYELFNTGNQALLSRLKRDKLIPDLRGTDIRVAGIGRAGTPDRRPLSVGELNKLVEFWSAYFEAASAAKIEIGQNLVRKARSETVKAKTDRQ
jgi:hypothetical protein